MIQLPNKIASSKAGANVCDVMAGKPLQTEKYIASSNDTGYASAAQRARLLSPKSTLENVHLTYGPNAALTHRSAVGQIAARHTLTRIEDMAADPDQIFLNLKAIISCELSAAVLAELRTYCRLIQRALEEPAS